MDVAGAGPPVGLASASERKPELLLLRPATAKRVSLGGSWGRLAPFPAQVLHNGDTRQPGGLC
jgi:hypothetical protein